MENNKINKTENYKDAEGKYDKAKSILHKFNTATKLNTNLSHGLMFIDEEDRDIMLELLPIYIKELSLKLKDLLSIDSQS
ncbi:hypothetical protein [Clostridium cadaveris]|uniref:hypothetical protein n=1 Tax=Clostridium cadaveris TaxID=1529 RepID=UPI003992BC88